MAMGGSSILHSRWQTIACHRDRGIGSTQAPSAGRVRSVTQGEANYFRFRLSPDVSISLGARTKITGEAMVGEPVELVVRQASGDEMTPYERLLGDAHPR